MHRTVLCLIAGNKQEATPASLYVLHTVTVIAEARIECGSCVRMLSAAAHWIDRIMNLEKQPCWLKHTGKERKREKNNCN